MILGTLLREARGDERSIYQVEWETGIAHSVISKAERGKALPSLPTLLRLAGYYGANTEEWIAALERDRINAQRTRMEEGEVLVIPVQSVA
ncbi:MAG: helix-turn-helix transcriptional regulator [Thermomicrobia bacterium]|nr:helix-turn-helix transcriptional regulator [Thermomicrobia bacterium]